MKSFPARIMEHAEATPTCPAALLHPGKPGGGDAGSAARSPFRDQRERLVHRSGRETDPTGTLGGCPGSRNASGSPSALVR